MGRADVLKGLLDISDLVKREPYVHADLKGRIVIADVDGALRLLLNSTNKTSSSIEYFEG